MNSKAFITLSIIFALIIGSTLQIAIVNAENAEENDNLNREKELVENLISIYENIRERALEILENQSLPEEIIEEINNAIIEGDALIEQAKEKISIGNYTQAIDLAKEAINSLGNVIRKHLRFRERIKEKVEEQAAKGLLVAIKRHRTMIGRLENLLEKLKEKGFLIDDATTILEEAKGLLNEAESLVEEGNITGAAHKMAESRNLIGKAMSTVKMRAHEKLMHKIRNEISRITKEIEKVEKHIRKIKEKIPPKIANKTKIDEKIQRMSNNLEQLKQRLSDLLERKFESAIEGMKNLKELHGKFKGIQKEVNETKIEED